MLSRRLTRIFLVCLAVTLNLSAQTVPGSSFLAQVPGASSGANRLVVYTAGSATLDPVLDTAGPTDAEQMLVAPGGNRTYIISTASVQWLDSTLQNFAVLNGVQGPVKKAEITPDGKYLIVQGASLYVINIATNAIANTNLGLTGTMVDFAVTPDSKQLWVLQSFGFTTSIAPVNLSTFAVGTRTDLPYPGTRVTFSPLGQMYVTAGGRIVEYNPKTLAVIAALDVVGNPGRLYFTPDGLRAYYLNQNPENSARSIQTFRTAQRDITEWPPFSFTQTAPYFDELIIVSNDRLFAYQKAEKKLWEVTPSPLGAAVTTFNNKFLADQVFAVTKSNEYPSARFLYVLATDSSRTALKRIALANDAISAEANTNLTSGAVRFVSVPPQTGVSNITKINDNQLVNGGGAGKKLMLVATDNLGRPVFNAPVTFTVEDGSGVVLSTPTSTTTSQGYADTDVTLPSTPAVYTITATVGGTTTTYTLTVPGIGGGTPGGGGPQRISIFSGNGQVVEQGRRTVTWAPLTVKVVDEAGNPLAGVPVTFTVTQGTGVVLDYFPEIGGAQTVTDTDGLMRIGFGAGPVVNNRSFEQNVILAESPYGSVQFTVTVLKLNSQGSGAPDPRSSTPDRQTIGRGDLIKDFFVVETKALLFPDTGLPVPSIGLRVGADDFTKPGPGVCTNNTTGDNLGVSRCDFKSTCELQPGSIVSFNIVVGEFWRFPQYVNVANGTAQKITRISGNAQSGNVGQVLPANLVAQITDNCGGPVSGKSVIWSVTQGAATLSNVISTSASDGRVSARVNLGQTPGSVKVRVSFAGADPVEFTLTSNVVVSGVSLVSGGGQTATVGAAFANPVVFVVRDASNNPVPGVTLNFSAIGAGTVNPASATTDSTGRAQTSVTAAASTGAITVNATYLGFTASATLTSVPVGLNLSSSLFTNAASGASGLVPCGLITISAPGLAPGVTGVLSGISSFGPLPYSLGPIDGITVGGVPAPIQAVSNQNGKEQVNFQAPCEIAPGTTTVVVRVRGQNNTVAGVPVFAGQPGIFTFAGQNSKVYGAVIRLKDGSYITPSNPAVTGESYWMVLTGMGLTSPALTTNSPGLPNQTQNVNLQTIVGVNNQGVPAQQAKYLPGSIGVYYVEFTIPRAVLSGANSAVDLPLAVAVINNGNVTFGNPVLLPALVAGQ